MILIRKQFSLSDKIKAKVKSGIAAGAVLGGVGGLIGAAASPENRLSGFKAGAAGGGLMGLALGLVYGKDPASIQEAKRAPIIYRKDINKITEEAKYLFDTASDDTYGINIFVQLMDILNKWDVSITNELLDNHIISVNEVELGPAILLKNEKQSLVRVDNTWALFDEYEGETPSYKGRIKDYLIAYLRKGMTECKNSNNPLKDQIITIYNKRIKDLQKIKE